MSSLNKVCLLGRLTADPEVRSMQSGASVCNFSLATSENWRDKNTGEKREKTEFHRVVVFDEKLGGVIQQYCHKGSRIYLEGSLQTRSWEKDGQKRYSTEITVQNFQGKLVLLDSKPAEQEPRTSEPVQGSGLDSDIPF